MKVESRVKHKRWYNKQDKERAPKILKVLMRYAGYRTCESGIVAKIANS